jgi:pyruvate dehydrogenase E1 component
VLTDTAGPVVAVSDWMRGVPELIRPWVPNTYVTLGTDGFGFSDTRPAARRYFNTDAESVVVAVLEALSRDGEIDPSVAVAAAKQYKIDDVMAAGVSFKDTGSA